MVIFLNENNLYDLSVDGAKFSVTQSQMQKSLADDASKAASKLPGPANVFDKDPFSFNAPPVQQTQPLHYENPEKIFGNNSGVGDFKFAGFGKDAWGIYSAGGDSQPQHTQAASSTPDPFSNPFDKQDKTFEAFGSDFKFGQTTSSESKEAIWSAKETPQAVSSEEPKKENKKSLL